MNKRINAIILALVMVVNMLATAVPAYAAPAAPMITIEADKTEASPGDTITYKFYLQQPDTMTAFAFNMVAPDGLTYVEGSGTLGSTASEAWGSTFEWVPEADMQLQWYSSSGDDVTDTSKIELITIKFTVDADATIGAEYEMDLKNMQLAAGSTQNYDDISSTVEVTTAKVNIVAKPVSVTGVTVNETMSLKTGESKNLIVNVTPDGATNKKVTFAVTEGDAATVDANGKVTGVKEGTATVKVTTVEGNFSDTCTVTVACAHASKTATAEQDSDCKTQGWDAYSTCDACGQIFNAAGEEIADIPLRPLDETKHTGGTATCKTQAVCTVCGQSYGELDADEHEGVCKWVVTETPELTHKKVWDCCQVAGVPEGNHVDNNNDNICDMECGYDGNCKHEDPLTHHEAKPAECGVPGNVEYWECECGVKFAENDKTSDVLTDVTIEALEHSFTKEDKKEAALKTAGDCVKEAVYIKSCEHCGLVDTNVDNNFLGEKDATNHADYGEEIHEVPAKIGVTGLMAHYVCKCGKYFIDIDHDTHVEKKAVEREDLIIPALDNVIIKIKKVDENNQPLVGATFTMTGTNDGAGGPYTATSDENGIATFEVDSDGCYTITETTPPAGYKLGATREYIDVVNGVAIVSGEGFEGGQKAYDNNDPFVFENEQYKAEFYVTKLDNHDKPLAGAKFKLDGAVDYTAESNAEGIVKFTDVVDGEYVLSETTAPEGYIKSEDTYKFKIENSVVEYWSDRGAYVEYGNSISIVNEAEPTIINIPFTKKVEVVIANTTAPEASFEFATAVLSGFVEPEEGGYKTATITDDETVDGVTITIDPVQTDGEGSYNGNIEIKIADDFDLNNGKLAFFVTEKNTEAANWNYHPETMGYVVEITEAEADTPAETSTETLDYAVAIYAATTYGETVTYLNKTETIRFTNKYTAPVNYTFEIPFKKVVELGGNTAPDPTNFEFKLTPNNSNVEDWKVEGTTVETTGKGTFEGKLIITVAEEKFLDFISEGLMLVENNTGISNWTYDETAYLIRFQEPIDVAAFDENRVTDELTGWTMVAYEAEKLDEESDSYRPIDPQTPVEEIVFTNKYTYNYTPSDPTPSTPPTLNKEDHIAFMQGYTDGTFGPTKNMTRGEVATMFARLLTEKMEADKTYTNTFTDVPSDMWCYNYIGYMQQFGIIKGYPDGTFRPEAPISRAEFAAIACRFEELTEGTKTFSDVPETHWAAKYISYAAERGWVTGYTDGTFKPDANITREEVVAVTCRLLERNADADYINTNYEDLTKTYSDVEKDDWSFLYIMEASNGHDYTKNDGVETWVDLK